MRLLLILTLLFVGAVRAATINVASPPTLANAQTAYNAASTGDTIVFPLNGASTWGAGLAIGKAVTIVGNGTTLTAGATLNTGFLYGTGFTSSSLTRITGFNFNLVNFNAAGAGVVFANITNSNLRIDHNSFSYGYESLQVGGCKGVVDHNSFTNCLKAIGFTAGSVAQANASWVSMDAGTSDALFIEDNSFVYNASYPGTYVQESIGTENGGKLVVRYNTWNSTALPLSIGTIIPVITHGSAAGGVANGYWQQGTGARRGQSVVEIYNNTVTGARVDFLCQLRGSANLVHDNTLDTTAFNPRVLVYEEEQYESSNWNPLRTAWPAEDQVHNSFFWNNTLRLNGVANGSYFEVAASSTAYIQLNRDYFLHAPQSSGGKESFTGANGASSTYPTDGVLYPTLGTMTFSAVGANAYYPYTPYTYPYPSVGSNPSISSIANQTIAVDASTGPLAFTVGDPVDAPGSLTVSVTSSNHTLADDADCVLGGSDASRTVNITPNTGQSGTTTIRLIVTNSALLTATNTFTLTVTASGSDGTTVIGKPGSKAKGRGKLK